MSKHPTLSPNASDYFDMMADGPPNPGFDRVVFATSHAERLAQYLADGERKIPLQDAAMLLGVGSILLVLANGGSAHD